MTYLELINNVLVRLREASITAAQVDSNPYWASIGAHVNDAKDRVEDAWQWGALRGTDTFAVSDLEANVVGKYICLPDSADNHYIIKRILSYPNTTGAESFDGTRLNMRWVDINRMRRNYQTPSQAVSGQPQEFVPSGVATTARYPASQTGNIQIEMYPVPTDDSGVGDFWIEVDRVAHQAPLVTHNTQLLVPSLPVCTYATALASRERGEVGGTPTSELFAIADRHLGDAIAQDSALYPAELDWYANDQEHNTNVRFA